MSSTQPHADPSPPQAVALTASPTLGVHLADLHPRLRLVLLQRIAGIGTLADSDALLLLSPTTSSRRVVPAGRPPAAGAGARASSSTLISAAGPVRLYVGTDLDDAGVWDRARKFHATATLFLPDDDARLAARLALHLGAMA